jgi:hypothetical protein
MSRRPGLGLGFMQKFSDQYKRNNYASVDGIKFALPRYYQEKLFGENSQELKIHKGKFLANENSRLISKYNKQLEDECKKLFSQSFNKLVLSKFPFPYQRQEVFLNPAIQRCHRFNYDAFMSLFFKPLPNIDVLSNLDKFPEIKKIYDEENAVKHAQTLSVRRFFDMTIFGRNKL